MMHCAKSASLERYNSRSEAQCVNSVLGQNIFQAHPESYLSQATNRYTVRHLWVSSNANVRPIASRLLPKSERM